MASAGIWIFLLALAAWFTWCLRRFQLYWDAGDLRIGRLGAVLRQAQRELVEEQRRQEKMVNEANQFDRQADKAREEERQLRQQQREAPPPPAVEVLVAAELPASASEDPWIANYVRRPGARPSDRPLRPTLFWAAGYQAAMTRAQNIGGGDVTVNDAMRLTAPG